MRSGMTPVPLLLAPILLGVSFLSLARAEGPPLPNQRLGVRTAPLLLLSRPEVRADLGLSAEQVAASEREITALYVKAAGLKGKTGPDAIAARRTIDDAQQRWLVEHLSPTQVTRLTQIDLQWEGPSALLSRSTVSSTLNLSADQRKTLAEAIRDRGAERAAGKANPSDEASLADQALSILTPEQRNRWFGLLGRPCAFQVSARPTETPTTRR